jgi:serine/threonine-protein kinase
MSSFAAPVPERFRDTYDILGGLGSADDGASAYLARDRTTQELVALRVQAPASSGGEPGVTVARTLSSSIPADGRSCLICKVRIGDWRRFCVSCGADLSGVEPDVKDPHTRQLLERVLMASRERLEFLGQVHRSEGGGAVYFGAERGTGRILALDLRRSEQPAGQGDAYSLDVSAILQRHEAAKSTDATPAASTLPESARTPTPENTLHAEGTKVCPACGVEYDGRTRFCPDDGSVLRPKARSDDLIGEVVADRYHIVRLLGEGGMGRVYLADHVRMGRPCAIKVMHRAMSSDAGAVSRFAREAANASRINDENVAHIYDFGETKEHGIYLAMEYVEGSVLSSLIQREAPFSVERAVPIAIQVAKALKAAHFQNVVHRDLTPNNIVIAHAADGSELVKVVDFGIAKAIQDTGEGITRTGFVVGTPKYMSPEQLIAEPVDGRSDLYSLGCILFEMLTRAHPYGTGAGPEQIIRRLTEPPAHAREFNPNIPAALEAVLTRMLARDPMNRYPSAAELQNALTAASKVEEPKRGRLFGRRARNRSPEPATTGENREAAPAEPTTSSRKVVSGPSARLPQPPLEAERTDPRQSKGSAAPVTSGERDRAAPPPAPEPQFEERITDSEFEPEDAVAPRKSRRPLLIALSVVLIGAVFATAIATRQPALPPAQPERPFNNPQPPVPPPQPAPARIRFGSSLPSGAVVRVDGQIVRPADGTLELVPGQHTIEITAAGYHAVRETVQLEENRELAFSPVFQRIDTPPPPVVEGTLIFTATLPPSAVVRSDGRPLALQDNRAALRAGRHVIDITAPGMKPVQRTITVEAGQDLRWAPNFEREAEPQPQPQPQPNPPVQPVSFNAAISLGVSRFARSIETRDLARLRSITTQQTVSDIESVLDEAGTAAVKVDHTRIEPDSLGQRATLLLRIVELATQRPLLAWTEFEATFIKTGSGWALASVHRRR